MIYPVTISGGTLCVVARLPVEKIEPAYEYLIRELGNRHQRPFKCCSETAAASTHGSSIALRPIPKEKLSELNFGPTKARQKPMMLVKNGSPKVISISSNVRRMSDDTQEIFDTLF